MSKACFDSLIHAHNRLQICALLHPVSELEFSVVKAQLEVSDSVLSKHVKALEQANYISVAKRASLSRPRTWLSLTELGETAYLGHVAALKEIVGL
ncbi:MarR family transcriptional regulator [Pseudoalteromonas rubra]|uniref:MarR family transcriptional regulator n=1 Tax=Pseudoalteromonas rubra TaxID=43658 RepID=A0A5S3WTV8_9GAMM|nr:transcriptional regulator [Pseudoalteromonas rubra]TMP30140.1 MarR family transcriptional regulator [Pseudoalteromonas rubra]TMP31992.1 MarR family transcriptional regulator [Pseudoalteromonas rubra]